MTSLVPALPRPAWLVLTGDFISAVGSGLTLPCLFIYVHRVHGLSYSLAGLVVSMVALASLVGNPLGGALADRWTPRRALMVGLVLAAAGSAALALASAPAELFGATAVLGLGLAMAWPAQDALLASLVGPADRSTVFSVRHACLNAGLGLGAMGAAAVISVARPATFTVAYLADAASFLAYLPVLARLRRSQAPATEPEAPGELPGPDRQPPGFRQIVRDSVFVRVWLLTAVLVTVSFGQFQASFAGFAARPGGIGPRGLAVALAANTLAVVLAQLVILRRLAGHRRTTALALAAVAWATTWLVVAVGGQLGGGAAARAAFIAAAIVFALGECLLAPTLPAIINDIAAPGAAGRYNGLGVLAYTTGFLIGPAVGGAALSVGWGGRLFVALAGVCVVGGWAALRLGRRLPAAANHIPAARPPEGSRPIEAEMALH